MFWTLVMIGPITLIITIKAKSDEAVLIALIKKILWSEQRTNYRPFLVDPFEDPCGCGGGHVRGLDHFSETIVPVCHASLCIFIYCFSGRP